MRSSDDELLELLPTSSTTRVEMNAAGSSPANVVW
eukprot:CAMPEP_0172429074 /NCGR_PEP_ID=MMETSP1064-20121228/48935_1 /TAXON_ID=202472 /ORGANISM="Aulacoseira subarctica , Strain CCAP 1002/5" /LENGTH=34 /DNA_ID= /DNA_START= /DNA_END= /DNA_ORIENTATION=